MANPKPTFCDWHRARNGGIPNMTHDVKHPLLDAKPWIHSTQGRVFRSNKGVKSQPFWLTNWATWNKPERADMNYEWNWHPDWWKGKWRDPFNRLITIILWNHNFKSKKSLSIRNPLYTVYSQKKQNGFKITASVDLPEKQEFPCCLWQESVWMELPHPRWAVATPEDVNY